MYYQDRSRFQKRYLETWELYGLKVFPNVAEKAEEFMRALGLKSEHDDAIFDTWVKSGNKKPPTIAEFICFAKDFGFIKPPAEKNEVYHCKFCDDEGVLWRKNLITKQEYCYRCNCQNGKRHPDNIPVRDPNKKHLDPWFEITHDEWLLLAHERPQNLQDRINRAEKFTFIYDKQTDKESKNLIPYYFNISDKEENARVYKDSKYDWIKQKYPQYF